MLEYAGIRQACWDLLGHAGICLDMLGYAGICQACWDLLGHAGICLGMLGYARICQACWNLLGHAGICSDMLGYAGICEDRPNGLKNNIKFGAKVSKIAPKSVQNGSQNGHLGSSLGTLGGPGILVPNLLIFGVSLGYLGGSLAPKRLPKWIHFGSKM